MNDNSDTASEAAERARFEAWAKTRSLRLHRYSANNELYGSISTQLAYEAWNAALATPPAQKFIPADIEQWRALARKVGDFLHRKGEAFRCGEGAELLDAYEAVLARPEMRDALATPPAPSAPWQEQAARWHEEQAGYAAALARAEPSLSGASHFLQAEVAHHQHARDLRALLSKPAKGED